MAAAVTIRTRVIPWSPKPRPSSREHKGDQADLQRGIDLADHHRPRLEGLRQQLHDHGPAEDRQVPEHREDHEPRRQMAQPAERQEGRHQQRLVGQGIEIGAELRARIRTVWQEPVDAIGHAGGDEDPEGTCICRRVISQTMIGTASRRARVTRLGRLITDAVRARFWLAGRPRLSCQPSQRRDRAPGLSGRAPTAARSRCR